MKSLRVVLVLTCLSLPACHDFDFPLDPTPQVEVDARLLGAWKCLGAQSDLNESAGVLRVTRQTDMISRWTLEGPASDGTTEKSEYEAHGSTVKGGALLNVRDLGENVRDPGGKEIGKWSFVRYSFLLPNVLRIQLVNDEPFKEIKDAKSLRREVERRRNDAAIYADFLICVRPKPLFEPSPSPTPKP
jgi:hypothetical protein